MNASFGHHKWMSDVVSVHGQIPVTSWLWLCSLNCPFFLASFPRSCYWKLYCLVIHHPVLFYSPISFFFTLFFSAASQLLLLLWAWKCLLMTYLLLQSHMLHFIIGIQLCIWPSLLYSEFKQSEATALCFLKCLLKNLSQNVTTVFWDFSDSLA